VAAEMCEISFFRLSQKVSKGRCVGNGYDAYDDGCMDHELRSALNVFHFFLYIAEWDLWIEPI
jgi:hypothetical protein